MRTEQVQGIWSEIKSFWDTQWCKKIVLYAETFETFEAEKNSWYARQKGGIDAGNAILKVLLCVQSNSSLPFRDDSFAFLQPPNPQPKRGQKGNKAANNNPCPAHLPIISEFKSFLTVRLHSGTRPVFMNKLSNKKGNSSNNVMTTSMLEWKMKNECWIRERNRGISAESTCVSRDLF